MESKKIAKLNSLLASETGITKVVPFFLDWEQRQVISSENVELINSVLYDYCIVFIIRGSGVQEEQRIFCILDSQGDIVDAISLNGWKIFPVKTWRSLSLKNGSSYTWQGYRSAFSIVDPEGRMVGGDTFIKFGNKADIEGYFFNTFLRYSAYQDVSEMKFARKLEQIEAKLDILLSVRETGQQSGKEGNID